MMIELLGAYSIKDIIIFIFMIAVAIKEARQLWIYYKKVRDENYKNDHKDETQDEYIKKNQQTREKLSKSMALLIESDKDGIKAWIVSKYHQFKEHPEQLDDIEWDLLNKRFNHYKEQGGNSYIEDLMTIMEQIYKKNGGAN